MKTIELFDTQVDILINLVSQEIRRMAEIRDEFREKDIDCGGVITQIDRLQTILRELTNE